MNAPSGTPGPVVVPVTEIMLVGGERLRVQGAATEVEALVLSAARGSLLEFAWMTEARTGGRIAVNPEHVLLMRTVDPGPDAGTAEGSAEHERLAR